MTIDNVICQLLRHCHCHDNGKSNEKLNVIVLFYSYDVIADTIRPGGADDVTIDDTTVTGIPTSIVNATAPEPSVILRIGKIGRQQ